MFEWCWEASNLCVRLGVTQHRSPGGARGVGWQQPEPGPEPGLGCTGRTAGWTHGFRHGSSGGAVRVLAAVPEATAVWCVQPKDLQASGVRLDTGEAQAQQGPFF